MDRLTTIALCWRIERRDGVTIALTDHDRDLNVNGLVHRAAPGMTPAAIVQRTGLDVATTEARGALTAAAITERDLLAGRWDGATVEVFVIDWAGGSDRTTLATGTIGAIEVSEHGFSAELRGAAATLDRPAAEATSPECRAELGDRRCRVAMAERRRWARVVSAGDAIVVDAIEPIDNAYGAGIVRWMEGANSGLRSTVMASSGDQLMLHTPPPFAIGPGTLIELIEGCDKRIETCATRFGNAINFRGEPYLPGIDLLTRYPGA